MSLSTTLNCWGTNIVKINRVSFTIEILILYKKNSMITKRINRCLIKLNLIKNRTANIILAKTKRINERRIIKDIVPKII
jgi:hypothetical protein